MCMMYAHEGEGICGFVCMYAIISVLKCTSSFLFWISQIVCLHPKNSVYHFIAILDYPYTSNLKR